MASRFAGQTVLVAGGATGIGRASALWFAARGAVVYVGDVVMEVLDDATFLEAGIRPHLCDVRLESEVAGMVRRAVEETNRIDVVVYSAGVEVVGSIPEVAESDWDRCLDTNLKGAFLFAKHAIPAMAKQGGGAIVTIASNAGLLTRAPDPVYSISKAAIIAMTKALALCHAKDKVRVNALCPGPVGGTRMMDEDVLQAADPEQREREVIAACPLAQAYGRMATVEEMADAIGYLADPSSAFVTGAALAIDGGKSLGVPAYYGPREL